MHQYMLGTLNIVWKCLIGVEGKGSKEDRARLFQVVPRDRLQGNGQKLEYTKLHLNIRIFFFLIDQTLEQFAQRYSGVSALGDVQKLTGHGHEQPALVDHAQAGEVGPSKLSDAVTL